EVADDVVELVRLRSVDGAPNHVAHSFLPAALYPKAAEADLSQGSLYEYLRREYAADLAHARIVVDVGMAAPEEADLLDVVAGSPLLVVRTTVHDSGGHPLVANRVHRVTRQFVGEPGYHLLAELVFESPEAMKQAFKSDEWAASGADLQSWGAMELVTMFSAEPAGAGAQQ